MSTEESEAAGRQARVEQRLIDAEVRDSETGLERDELRLGQQSVSERGRLAGEAERVSGERSKRLDDWQQQADDRDRALVEREKQVDDRDRAADQREIDEAQRS